MSKPVTAVDNHRVWKIDYGFKISYYQSPRTLAKGFGHYGDSYGSVTEYADHTTTHTCIDWDYHLREFMNRLPEPDASTIADPTERTQVFDEYEKAYATHIKALETYIVDLINQHTA